MDNGTLDWAWQNGIWTWCPCNGNICCPFIDNYSFTAFTRPPKYASCEINGFLYSRLSRCESILFTFRSLSHSHSHVQFTELDWDNHLFTFGIDNFFEPVWGTFTFVTILTPVIVKSIKVVGTVRCMTIPVWFKFLSISNSDFDFSNIPTVINVERWSKYLLYIPSNATDGIVM